MLMRVFTDHDRLSKREAEAAVRGAEIAYKRLEKPSVEMSDVKLPPRLKRRCRATMDKVSQRPSVSFPQMCDSVGELVGMYRFFSNAKVTPEVLLDPHVEATRARIIEAGEALVVTDTSGVSFGGQGTRDGLGSLAEGGHGYYLHASLAVSTDMNFVPLGTLGFEALVRSKTQRKKQTPRQMQRDPEKESLRWRRGVLKAEALFESTDVKLIHVMDRDGDEYELLDTLVRNKWRFVIRSKYDRLLAQCGAPEEQPSAGPRKLREAVETADVVIERQVKLSPRKKDRSTEKRKTHPPREGRPATLHISAKKVCFKRPDGVDPLQFSDSIELNVVHVWEVDAPQGAEPVEWYLLTTEPIRSAKAILRVIDFYRARWVIEEFFKALKSGCIIERRQLETKDALLNNLALFLAIAHRLLLLRTMARITPTAPASLVLSKTQLNILRTLRPKLNLPLVPTLQEALLAIASVGGHLKHNGAPGWQTIGKGFQDLLAIERYLDAVSCNTS